MPGLLADTPSAEKAIMSKALNKLKLRPETEKRSKNQMPESVTDALVKLAGILLSVRLPLIGNAFALMKALPSIGHKMLTHSLRKDEVLEHGCAMYVEEYSKSGANKELAHKKPLIQHALETDFETKILRLPSESPPNAFKKYIFHQLDETHILETIYKDFEGQR